VDVGVGADGLDGRSHQLQRIRHVLDAAMPGRSSGAAKNLGRDEHVDFIDQLLVEQRSQDLRSAFHEHIGQPATPELRDEVAQAFVAIHR
jgi:hypothetical protein